MAISGTTRYHETADKNSETALPGFYLERYKTDERGCLVANTFKSARERFFKTAEA